MNKYYMRPSQIYSETGYRWALRTKAGAYLADPDNKLTLLVFPTREKARQISKYTETTPTKIYFTDFEVML